MHREALKEATGLMNNSIYFTLKKIELEIEYRLALTEVSEGLNHSLERENMTLFYLSALLFTSSRTVFTEEESV